MAVYRQSPLFGKVELIITGKNQERFLNLLKNRNISVSLVKREKDRTYLTISLKDFKEIRPLVRKTRIRVRIGKRIGLPFWVHYYFRKRLIYTIGFFLMAAGLIILSQYIWKIKLEGNEYYTEKTLLEFMGENGYHYGMKSSAIVCDDLETILRNEFPRITWVSAERKGTCLSVSVKENPLIDPELIGKEEPCDLKAEHTGNIVSIITRSGTPLVKAGDKVKTGDILVSGIVPLHDDAGEVCGYHSVNADADIWMEASIHYEKTLSNWYQEKINLNSRKGVQADIGNFHKVFYMPGKKENTYEESRVISQLCIFHNWYLPVYFGTTERKYYDMVEKMHTRKEMEELCKKEAELKIEKLKKKGVSILKNNVTIYYDLLETKMEAELLVRLPCGIPEEINMEQGEIEWESFRP